ncbi:acylneuraminate cytidylyltransferase family protein [uncultured Desulfobacter sp.]|uniref:acylneuraminate cytidylyltransferase family protein n=1 Tax=uncultured Desulfobacter sp. TaxID=240139 RepID=UPI002AAA6983|nr:acylneuraminate cytidylyltransferase family protein [uncultured Desulfobacter sp.]
MEEKPEIIAIIPARGGSKGLYKKNIRLLNGKPLIAYTIASALKCKNITKTLVSTEDNEIAEISKAFNAEVPFLRPRELAMDKSSIGLSMEYTLKRLEDEYSYVPDILVELYPTSPFRTASMMNKLTNILLDGVSSVKTVVSVPADLQYYYQSNKNKLRRLKSTNCFPDEIMNSYFFRMISLFYGRRLRGGKQVMHMETIENPIMKLDIDYLSDFEIAEKIIEDDLFNFDE